MHEDHESLGVFSKPSGSLFFFAKAVTSDYSLVALTYPCPFVLLNMLKTTIQDLALPSISWGSPRPFGHAEPGCFQETIDPKSIALAEKSENDVRS